MPRHNGRDARTNPAAFLGEKLRQGRTNAGFSSQDALAAKLGFDRTVITKAETGDRPPTPDVLSKWCEACSLDLDMFTGLAELARSTDGPIPTWFEDWLDAEGKAHTIRIWQPLIVPGLLQTADYARELFIATRRDAEWADEQVTARLERQSILDRADPPNVVVVLDEAVLHRLVGTSAVMHDQLTRLVAMAERPNISLEIVPASTGANAGLSGGFQLASCDSAPEVLNMTGVEDVTQETSSLVREAVRIFDLVRGDALPRVASRALILEAAEQWKTG
jgi:transcriptional regulator with XRE-family HTH domain